MLQSASYFGSSCAVAAYVTPYPKMGSWSCTDDYVSSDFPYPTPTSPLTPTFSRPFSKPPTNILILGATGTIGNYITRAILDAKLHFGRICIYTSAETVREKTLHIAGLEAWGLEVFHGDLSDEQAFKDVLIDGEIDTIISCVGRNILEKQIPIITWADECGVTRFFASEFGTDIDYFPHSKHEPPHQKKLAVREHMKTCKTMEYTYLVTGPYSDLYFGQLNERPEVGSFDAVNRKAWLLGDGDGLVSFTAMADVGKFVVASLINYATSRNTTLMVHSFTTTPNEILAEFEQQTGQKWDVSYTSLDRLRHLEKQAYKIHSPMSTVLTMRRIWTEGGTLYKFYDDSLLGQFETQRLDEQVASSIRRQSLGGEDSHNNFMRKLSAP